LSPHDQTAPERLVGGLNLELLRDHALADDVKERSERRGHAHTVDRLDVSLAEP
jgi:hypothetical protein